MGTHCLNRSIVLLPAAIAFALLLNACSGPDQFGGDVQTPTATVEITATETPTSPPEPSPTPVSTPSPEATPEPDPTPTDEPVEPTATPEPDPTPEPEPTPTEEPTATPQPVPAADTLPDVEDLSEGGFILVNEGDRTADQLAQAYIDPAAHLARLEEWGFRQHVFREFTRNSTGEGDTLPTYVLATVNVYGSPEQADLARQWLERLQVSQGATVIDPPEIGDAALAMSQQTSTGEAVAWVVFTLGDRVHIFYAQGNEPMPEAVLVATNVYRRLSGGNETV